MHFRDPLPPRRFVGRHWQMTAFRDQPQRVESFVATDGYRLRNLLQQPRAASPYRAAGLKQLHVADQPVVVFHQQIPPTRARTSASVR